MEQMWNMLIRNGLTPNQFYVLYSIRERETTPLVNTALEYRTLKLKGWVLESGELTTKALRVIKEVEGFFKKAKKKSSKILMGDDFEDKINAYNDLWPKRKLPSGKPARSAIGNLEDPFRWFFDKYNFTWEQVLTATVHYLNEKELANWEYTRTSQYFIRKQLTDKSWSSELADCCQFIEDGGEVNNRGHFKEKVW